MIKVKDLKKSFGKNEIIKGISLEVEQGQALSIIGPSGSGKTTLLRCLNLLEKPDSGYLTIDDVKVNLEKITNKEIQLVRRKTSMVFQQYDLFINKTALENITEGLIIPRNQPKNEAIEIGMQLLKDVGLEGREHHYPAQLSGGQQQRVGIARALAVQPKVILFDEPTSSLDPELVGEILEIIKNVTKTGITTVIVTHEIGFAYQVADKVIFMDNGFIIEDGSPEEVIKSPKEERTKSFLEKTFYNINQI